MDVAEAALVFENGSGRTLRCTARGGGDDHGTSPRHKTNTFLRTSMINVPFIHPDRAGGVAARQEFDLEEVPLAYRHWHGAGDPSGRRAGDRSRAGRAQDPVGTPVQSMPHSAQAAHTMSSRHIGAWVRSRSLRGHGTWIGGASAAKAAPMPGRVLAAGLAMAALVLAIPALSQTINTVAGGGAGDGGDATIANLNSPAGVAVDSSGNLYIADLGNERIRKVAGAAGVIPTAAGKRRPPFPGHGRAGANA